MYMPIKPTHHENLVSLIYLFFGNFLRVITTLLRILKLTMKKIFKGQNS